MTFIEEAIDYLKSNSGKSATSFRKALIELQINGLININSIMAGDSNLTLKEALLVTPLTDYVESAFKDGVTEPCIEWTQTFNDTNEYYTIYYAWINNKMKSKMNKFLKFFNKKRNVHIAKVIIRACCKI
jgi:hypothetical protein